MGEWNGVVVISVTVEGDKDVSFMANLLRSSLLFFFFSLLNQIKSFLMIVFTKMGLRNLRLISFSGNVSAFVVYRK